MQRLLGRALEARGSCNCAICTPIGPGLARNANNTLPAKRRLKFSDVVNVVYGTIIGTAALYDGTVKNNRRRAVDSALLGLLQENEAVIQNQEARLRALGYEGSESEATLSEDVARRFSDTNLLSWNTILRRPSLLKPIPQHLRHYSIRYLNHQERSERNREGWWQTEMQARQEERITDRLQISSRTEQYTVDAQHQTEDGQAAQPHPASQPEPRFVGRTVEQAWAVLTLICNERTWQIREAGVAQLVLKLIKAYLTISNAGDGKTLEIRLRNSKKPNSKFGLSDRPRLTQLYNDLDRRIEDIKLGKEVSNLTELIEHIQFPRFLNYKRYEGIGSFYHSDVRDLNDEIASIFVQATNSADLISRLCSLLVSSPVGPDIHTMNLLLLLFLDLQWYQACKAVVHVIGIMGMNQNEITDLAKLQFYHLTQQDANLDTQRACMLGMDGRVTRAAFRLGDLTTEAYCSEQVVTKLVSRGAEAKLLRGLKAGWTAEAFSVVIIDLLDREELHEALAEIAIMKLSGFQETPDVLEALLQYSAFKQDWNLTQETWLRYDDLGQERPVLAWYWMLQACASCQQSRSFYQIAAAGQQLGPLDPAIEYSLESFELSASEQARLKLRVHALRRLKDRISIPGLPQRDLLVQEDDIVQLPNLQKTMLMVYLQYAKLRNATHAWLVDHLGFLYDAETQFERVVSAKSATPQLLQHVKAKWTNYNRKLDAFVSKQNGQSRANGTGRTMATERVALNAGSKTMFRAGVLAYPASSKELLASLEYYRLATQPEAILLEASDTSEAQRVSSRPTLSLESSSSRATRTTPKYTTERHWHQVERHNVAAELGPVPIRYTKSSVPSVILRKTIPKRNPLRAVVVENTTSQEDVVKIQSSAAEEGVTWQTPSDYLAPRPVSAPPRAYAQHDTEPDEVFEQDLSLVAVAY